MLKYAKKIWTYMQNYFVYKYAQNMHKYAEPNIRKYAFSKYTYMCVLYAQICIICWNMHKYKYAIIYKFKYSEICTKYAQICKNMQ